MEILNKIRHARENRRKEVKRDFKQQERKRKSLLQSLYSTQSETSCENNAWSNLRNCNRRSSYYSQNRNIGVLRSFSKESIDRAKVTYDRFSTDSKSE